MAILLACVDAEASFQRQRSLRMPAPGGSPRSAPPGRLSVYFADYIVAFKGVHKGYNKGYYKDLV